MEQPLKGSSKYRYDLNLLNYDPPFSCGKTSCDSTPVFKRKSDLDCVIALKLYQLDAAVMRKLNVEDVRRLSEKVLL